MKLSKETISNAYQKHQEMYHGLKLWDIPYHIECWEMADTAFRTDDKAVFEKLYDELKNKWQAFRPKASSAWSPNRTFEQLCSFDQRLRESTLSEVRDGDVSRCSQMFESMSGIKPMKRGPSVVAISKFLHFWNPQLFIIVDDAVMWRWVFGHKWIWQPIERMRDGIKQQLGIDAPVGEACDVLSYLAIIRWSADLVRANPFISECFARYVLSHGKTNLPIGRYQAAAVEWLLLGLVELPPKGVRLIK